MFNRCSYVADGISNVVFVAIERFSSIRMSYYGKEGDNSSTTEEGNQMVGLLNVIKNKMCCL
jgi:hypothetical protein